MLQFHYLSIFYAFSSAIGRQIPTLEGMEDVNKQKIDWAQHRAYSYPPDVITRPIIRFLVPLFDQFTLVVNTYKASSSQFSFARQHFDYCIKIGDYRSPAVITPCRRQWTSMVKQPYHRFYREASATYLFIKGYPRSSVEKFQQLLQKCAYYQKPASEKAVALFLQKLTWSGRQLFEILE